MDNNSTGITTAPHRFTYCINCGHSIRIFNFEEDQFFACEKCGSFFQVNENGRSEILRAFSDSNKFIPYLPIGRECQMEGVQWVVSGCIQKEEDDDGDIIQWHEYMLFNKKHGYSTLVELDGHWTFVRPLGEQLIAKQISDEVYIVEHEGRHFDLYHSYSFRITSAIGAFDENILLYEQMHTWEYIAPPDVIVNEVLRDTSDWYYGSYVSPAFLAKSLGLKLKEVPRSKGVGLIQPSPSVTRRKLVYNISIALAIAMLAVVIFLSYTRDSAVLLNAEYTVAWDSTSANGACKPIVTEPFRIQSLGGLRCDFNTWVNNDWMEISGTLVNETTGQSYEFSKAIEFYTGVEGGESWSEGDRDATTFLASIPPGTYHLNLFPFTSNKYPAPIIVKVYPNGWIGANVLVMLMLICSIPYFNHVSAQYFENKRTGNA